MGERYQQSICGNSGTFATCPTLNSYAGDSTFKKTPLTLGGTNRKWYGNNELVVNWEHDGFEIRNISSKHPCLLCYHSLIANALSHILTTFNKYSEQVHFAVRIILFYERI